MTKQKRTRQFLFAAAIAVMLTMASYTTAQKVSESELLFREALHKQQVEGDLPAAIKLYQNIVSSKTNDRAVKARALLQLASCFETLGRQSETVYQQILRDFADQPAAIQARAKLNALRPPAPPSTMTMRKIEFGDGVQNVVATDGERAVYWDSNHTTLYFGDVKGKDKRTVFQAKGRIPDAFVSRDLTMVFLFFGGNSSTSNTSRYAIVKTDGTGYRDFTLMANGAKVEPTLPTCLSWSWDNRYLAICRVTAEAGTSDLLKVSVADGDLVNMLGERTSIVQDAAFSPDGRFIAYSERVAAPGARPAVHIIPAPGGEPRLIAPAARVGDWTRDGRYLVIGELPPAGAINVDGARKMSAVPIQNGQAVGDRVAINANLESLWTRSNGTMTMRTQNQPGGGQIFFGTVDSEGHLGPWKTIYLNDAVARDNTPDLSPDGRQVVYRAGLNFSAVRVRDLASGEDREVYRSSGGRFSNCLWARRLPKLFCAQQSGTPLQTEILSINLDSGRAEKTVSFAGSRRLRWVTPDDRMLVTNTNGSGFVSAFQWEIGTDPSTEKTAFTFQSRDGRWALTYAYPDGRRRIMIRDTSEDNGDMRVLVQTKMQPISGAIAPMPVRFTPDGKWVVYQDKDADGKAGLYRVSVSGGSPERLGDYPTSEVSSGLSISADGRQFLVEVPTPPKPSEFWVLENVIPAAPPSSAKPAAKPLPK